METILLIENDPATLVARALILRCLGYTILEAGSRDETWSVCSQHPGPIHLAILDNVASSEFVTRLQILCPQIRVLLVSDKAPGELNGMPCEYAFLPKPFRADGLADAIRVLLDGSRTRAVVPCS
jgi:DNA-binding response OmpR family regulator